jgi:hypothetical protein
MVVLTCSREEINSLQWRSDSFHPQEPVSFFILDSTGEPVNCTTFMATLTQAEQNESVSVGAMTSTLTATATASLDGAVVECSAGGLSESITLRVTSGTQ